MLKTTAFYISFLGSLSLIYHIIYWGRFDIDIFQFISLQDFVTGIAYPLRIATAFAIGIFLLIAFTHPWAQKNQPAKLVLTDHLRRVTKLVEEDYPSFDQWLEAVYNENPKRITRVAIKSKRAVKRLLIWTAVSIALIAVGLVVLYVMYFDTNHWLASVTAFLLSGLVIILVHFAYGRFKNILGLELANERWKDFVDEAVLNLMIFLPINAALAGYTEAQRVLTRETYKYVASADLPLPAGTQIGKTLIYLGKVSTSYFFVSPDFKQHFVVPVDKAPVLNYQVYIAP